jgi:uncharacterized membrane protein
VGATILVVGVIWSVVLAATTARRSRSSARAYLVARQAFGGTLLLGLEVLVAADLVRTVTSGAGTIHQATANARDSGSVP